MEYLYAEVDTWHTTCSDGTQVFHFASGQAEAHRPDGSKEVRRPAPGLLRCRGMRRAHNTTWLFAFATCRNDVVGSC